MYFNTYTLHGQNKDALAKFGKNAWEYDVRVAGYKCNMPDVLAAIGLVEIRKYIQDTLPRRREIVKKYNAAFMQYKWAKLPVFTTQEKDSSCHLYLLRIKGCVLEERNAIIQHIFQQEVSVNVHYKPLPLLTYYKEKGYAMDDYTVSKDAWERVITLPVFYDITEEQIQAVIDAVVYAVQKVLHI